MQKSPKKSVVESIILMQSVFLMAFGLAGFMASSTVVAGMKALTNANSAAAIITNGALVTENESIGIGEAERIVANFEIVCTSALAIGSVIIVASLVRLALRRNN